MQGDDLPRETRRGDDSPTTPFEPTQPEESVGQRLRRLRRDRSYSQRDLAAASGVSYSYISRLEASSRSPSVRALRALARALGVTTEYLENGVDLTATEQLELRFASTVVAGRLDGTGATRAELGALAEAATAAADHDLAARAQIAAAEAAFRARDYFDAVSRFEQALRWDGAAPAVYPELHVGYARACGALGQRREALRILDSALDSLESPGPDDPGTRTRLLACLAELLTESGGMEDARTAVARAVAAAEQFSSMERARSLSDAARAAWTDGAGRVALRAMRDARAVVTEADARLELGRAALFCAEQLVWSGEYEAAGAILESGAMLAARADTVLDARARALEAVVVAGEEPSRAKRLTDDATRLFAGGGSFQAMVLYARARTAAASAQLAEANTAFGATVDMLERLERLREAGLVCREWERVMRAAGEPEEAMEILDRAAHLSARANAERIRRSL